MENSALFLQRLSSLLDDPSYLNTKPHTLTDTNETITEQDLDTDIILEMLIKALPSFIFLILALVRFCEISPIGF